MTNSAGRTAEINALSLTPVQQVLLFDAVDRAPALVFVADEEMRYVAVNQTACDVLGYTREEFLGLSVTDVAISVDAASNYEQMVASREHTGSTEVRAKDGRVLQLTYRASEVRVANLPYFVSVGFVD